MINLSASHLQALNKIRRTIINYDCCCSYPPFIIDSIELDELADYSCSLLDTKDHSVDSVWWNFQDADEAPYPSKFLPPYRLKKYRKWLSEGKDIVRSYVAATHKRGYETFISYRVSSGLESDYRPEAFRDMGDQIGISFENQVIGDSFEMLAMKREHPDWTFPGPVHAEQGETYKWNFAVSEVRKYKLNIVQELAENYELEGIELDFCRGIPFFRIDQQWEQRECMTEWVRSVRQMTLNIEKQRGRPFLLAARVPDNVLGARIDGLDLETWAQQNLVDIFVPGSRSLDIDFDGFRRITSGTPVKIYPCLDAHHSSDAYQNPTMEVLRGVITNWWYQGADAIETFNFPNVTPEAQRNLAIKHYPAKTAQDFVADEISSEPAIPDLFGYKQKTLYSEIGNFESRKYKDKTFVVQRRGGGLGHTNINPDPDDWYTPTWGYTCMNMFSQLPATIDNNGTVDTLLTLLVGDDVNNKLDRIRQISLNVLLSDPSAESLPTSERLEETLVRKPDTKLGPSSNVPPAKTIQSNTEVRLNGVLLGTCNIENGWLVFNVSTHQVAHGDNIIGIRVKNRPSTSTTNITIEKLELHVNYS